MELELKFSAPRAGRVEDQREERGRGRRPSTPVDGPTGVFNRPLINTGVRKLREAGGRTLRKDESGRCPALKQDRH